jgi:large subunit ribosomal protein L23
MNTSTDKNIIIKPRLTEKSAILQEDNVYTFDIAPDANKNEVKKEIQRIYKVTPVKVNIAKAESKKVFIRGR